MNILRRATTRQLIIAIVAIVALIFLGGAISSILSTVGSSV